MTQTAQALHEGNITNHEPEPCPNNLAFKLPKRPETGPPIGLALSGGGFRATFAALGVIRYLADIGMLQNLWISSSVSGGSVTNSLLAKHWPDLRTRGFTATAVDELVIDPLVERIANESLQSHLYKNAWRAIGKKNRTDVLAWAFDKWFLGNMTLDQLDPGVRWVINAANMATASRFTFERTMVGDYVNGYLSTNEAKVKLALAAATSAAVPGLFSPIELKGMRFPCRGADTVSLLDGGAYDNTGIEVLNSSRYDKDLFTICLAAGGIFKVGGYAKIPLVRDLKQSHAVLYRQTRALRTRDMVSRFEHHNRKGLVFKLNTSQANVEQALTKDDDALERVGDFVSRHRVVDFYNQTELAYVHTTFKQFDEALSRRLIYRGWWNTGLGMAAFHPQMPQLDPDTQAPTF